MRTLVLGLFVSILLVAPAAAAQGYRGKIKTTIALGASFFKAADPRGTSGLAPGDFTIPPVTGMLYLSGSRLRMDMTTPQGTLTTLFDGQSGYLLDSRKRVAWLMPGLEASNGDLPLFNLDAMANNWETVSQQLANTSGLTARRLGRKTVNGMGCTGVKFSGDIRTLLAADEVQIVPGLPTLTNLKGNWTGTFWVSDKLGLPIRMASSFSGIDLTWQVLDLKAIDVPDALLRLPPGFKVRPMEQAQSAASVP
jgi:hypothetical protein